MSSAAYRVRHDWPGSEFPRLLYGRHWRPVMIAEEASFYISEAAWKFLCVASRFYDTLDKDGYGTTWLDRTELMELFDVLEDEGERLNVLEDLVSITMKGQSCVEYRVY